MLRPYGLTRTYPSQGWGPEAAGCVIAVPLPQEWEVGTIRADSTGGVTSRKE